MKVLKQKKAWVITVDMGYGHQRAAYPLADIAYEGVLTMNNYDGLPQEERRLWEESRSGYEIISRLQARSFVGNALFHVFDKIQEIPHYYPRRDLSGPSLQLLQTYFLIEKQGLGRHLFTEVLSKNSTLPLICTFFLPAFAAEYYNYPGDIYCQICDADFSRTWVARDPKHSRIKYFAPNRRVVDRLKLYGVREENIFFTGFPLPKENIGGESMNVLRRDLGSRILNLDPHGLTQHKFGHIINFHIGKKHIPKKSNHPLTLTFAVGGAGAQSNLAIQILSSLREKISSKKIRIVLVAGTRTDVLAVFKHALKETGLLRELGRGVHILFEETKPEYFKSFNACLRTTDILWTKPSELSFYVGLGIPIIMAPSVGSQEDFNRVWLKTVAAGITQDDPRYTDEWLFDWIESGWLARAALNGFVEAPILGTYAIEKIITGKDHKFEELEEKTAIAV